MKGIAFCSKEVHFHKIAARKMAVQSGPKRNIRMWLETQPDMLKEAYRGSYCSPRRFS